MGDRERMASTRVLHLALQLTPFWISSEYFPWSIGSEIDVAIHPEAESGVEDPLSLEQASLSWPQ